MSLTPDFVAAPFRWGAALRQRRLFHPDGVLAHGVLERVAPAGAGLPVASSEVVARFSKALGTPGALPDAVGLALRVATGGVAAWDILLVSAGSGVLSRAIGLHPITAWSGTTMSTLMPLHYDGQIWWLRARIVTGIDAAGVSLSAIAEQITAGGIRVELDQARGTAAFDRLAEVTLTGLARSDDVSFDPVLNTAPGVELRPGWLAGLRVRAYRGSRSGRAGD